VTNLWPALLWAVLVGATARMPAHRPLEPLAHPRSIPTARSSI
jgi:hypothetical protein